MAFSARKRCSSSDSHRHAAPLPARCDQCCSSVWCASRPCVIRSSAAYELAHAGLSRRPPSQPGGSVFRSAAASLPVFPTFSAFGREWLRLPGTELRIAPGRQWELVTACGRGCAALATSWYVIPASGHEHASFYSYNGDSNITLFMRIINKVN